MDDLDPSSPPIDRARDDHPARGPRARVVEWYRPDATPAIRRALLPAALLMTLGALALAHTVIFREPPDVPGAASSPAPGTLSQRLVRPPAPGEVVLLGGGLLLIGAGGLTAILGLRRLMDRDSSLIVRTDGLHWQSADAPRATHFDWYELQGIGWDPDRRALVLAHRDGRPPFVLAERFADIDGADLARRLDDLRRKAIFGLL
jgi:hypothetical protein